MSYIFEPTRVSVCFYDMSGNWRGKLIKLLSLTNLHHCGILLEREEKRIVLTSDKTHKAKFVDADKFHKHLYQPVKVMEYKAEADVSIQQLTNFLYGRGYSYIGDMRSVLFWFFLGRLAFPRMLPPSCALLVCYLLRMCGIEVESHVEPRKLYKELNNAANSDSWTSRSWEDYLGTDNC